jgi:hypothetical protein
MKNLKLLLGIVLLAVGFFYNDLPIDRLLKHNISSNNQYDKLLTLTKPSDTIYQEVKDIKSIVSGPDEVFDRELIAIFNNEMGKKIATYDNVTTLAFENYYYDAGKMYFEGRISKKYSGLGDKLYKVILSTLGENESILSKEDFKKLSEKMQGIAWVLLN